MEASKEIVSAVHEILKNMAQAYLDKDLKGMMQLYVPDPDLVVIGAGRDEWVKGPGELKIGYNRDMTQADKIEVDFEDVTVSSSGNVAWVSARMAMDVNVENNEITIFGRLSMVLEKREDKWLIAHLHFSVPDEQEEGKSYPV
ncbi:MAG: nuclear transport factor 2 family protein [Methanothermobacter sp.]